MPGLSRKDGKSEGAMYKSIIKRKKSLLLRKKASVHPQCEGTQLTSQMALSTMSV